jgi:hypothetical protein
LTRLATIALAVCLLCLAARESRADTCQPSTVGLDTSYANAEESSIGLGEAMGQTFLARDTLIESITTWRPAQPNPWDEGYQLFILATDSTGAPDANHILLEGPIEYAINGDGVHPVPLVFTFDPPFQLPGPGEYEVAFLGAPCTGTTILILNGNNAYPDGGFWLHGRSFISGCRVRPDPRQLGPDDMIFEVEFCSPTVPTLPATWGRVKASYR